jgi:exo-poly-alpha-galacturonosidase
MMHPIRGGHGGLSRRTLARALPFALLAIGAAVVIPPALAVSQQSAVSTLATTTASQASVPSRVASQAIAEVVASRTSGTSNLPMATSPPAAPTDLRVPTLAFDEQSITLAWEKPAAHTNVVDYHIYRGGALIGNASDNPTSPAKPYFDAFYADASNANQVRIRMTNYTVTGLQPNTSYQFTVRAVDASGAESIDSNVVTQSTTATPAVFNVAAYGAVGDGVTLNTRAIQAAIDATTPGGKVVIPAGVFLSGAIWLKSNMTLQVAAGGTLLGSANADDYPWNFLLYDYSTDKRFYSLINAHTYDYGTLTNIRIIGPGTIDGNGWKQAGVNSDGFLESLLSSSTTVAQNGVLAAAQVVKAAALGSTAPYATRSNLITLRGVTNAYYGNFTAHNPSNHTLVNVQTKNVTVNGVRLETYDVNNADGVEFGNSDGLTVINNVFDTGDDDMNFAAGLGAASQDDPSSGDAWIANNYFREGHGAIVAGSHTGAWIQNIVAEDNVMNHTDVGLRMKTNPINGGGARNVLFRDNAMKDVSNEGFIFTSEYSDAGAAIVIEPAAQKAQFHDILVDNITVDGTGKESIKVVGVADQPHQNLNFRNVRFLKAKASKISYLKNSSFTNVRYDATANPWVVTKSSGLVFDGGTTTTTVTTDAASGPVWAAGSALSASATTNVATTLTWPAATDNVAVANYRIYEGDKAVGSTPGGTLSYQVTGLAPALTYTYRVVAEDGSGNLTNGPTTSVTTTGTRDGTLPVAPSGPTTLITGAGSLGTTWVGLQWQPATDNYGVKRYDISANGKVVGTVDGNVLAFTATKLLPATTYTFTVTAYDATGNWIVYGAGLALRATTYPTYDKSAPKWPTSGPVLKANAVERTTVTLGWLAATDDVAITGYRIYKNGRPVPDGAAFTPINSAQTTYNSLSYMITGLTPNTTYTFKVEAGDAVGKWTGSGPSITVTTKP